MAYFSKLMRSTNPDNAKDKKSPEVPQDKDPKIENQATQTPQVAESNGHTKIPIEPAKIPGTQNNEANRPPSAPKASSANQQKAEPSNVAANSKPISSSAHAPDRRVADRIKPFVNKFLFGARITDNLDSLTSDLKELFNCKEVTIYSVDRKSKQIYSRNFRSKNVDCIRLDINKNSIAGFVASTGKTINIEDPRSKQQRNSHHPDLSMDSRWDKKLNFKTQSALVFPLVQGKRLVGVLQFLNKNNESKFPDSDVYMGKELASVMGHTMVRLDAEDIEDKIRTIERSTPHNLSIDGVYEKLQKSLLHVFDAQGVTIYSLDVKKNELCTKTITGEINTKEIRIPVDINSIAGCVARIKKTANILDVYNPKLLEKFHPKARFDSTWDKKSNTMTQSLLATPLMLGENMMGVLQVTNKKQGSGFTDFDEKNLKGIGDALAVALSHLKKSPNSPLSKFSYLLDNNILTPEDLKTATAAAKKRSVLVETELLENFKLPRKKIGKSLEQYYGKPYTGYDSSVDLPPQVFSGLNKNYLSRNNWVPIKNNPKSAVILVDDPSDIDKIRNIGMIFPKKSIEFHVSLREDILDFLNHASGLEDLPEDETHTEEMSSLLIALQDEESMASLDEAAPVDDDVNSITESDSTIVRLVNKVLTDAYDKGISDIHLEPGLGKKDMRVRFRKDGTCQVYQKIPFKYKQAIISRLKIMAKLDIAERRMPQDGKIKMRYGRKEIEYRVATCPTVGGNEDAVLRILADSKPIPLKGMKFSDNNLKLIEEMTQKPYGLILVVGPTGSGKTTTLHSCLGHINTDDRKIWTAEDPVEITQDGLRQVQMLNKIGLNFARAMRSFLRGDPDVIMVGEMRDTETASIGLEASLTGHLVMSTLHTNSAPETIVRLLDMGMNPLNFADALLLIVAQRLVRTLCKECKVAYNPTRDDFDLIVREYGEEAFVKNLGIEYSADLNIYKPGGCSKCGDTGYAGRMGLHELLSATKEMKRKIMDNNKVEELRNQAISDGMTTLKQDGIDKIFQGYCDLKQVLAVCIV